MSLSRTIYKIAAVQTAALALLTANAAMAEDEVSSRRVIVESQTKVEKKDKPATESSSYSRGVGFKNANVFNPKYKERLTNFEEQIRTGLAKGWINQAQASKFRARLAVLKTVEAKVSAKNYPKAELDDMEKQFTLYNQDFSKAASSKQLTTVTAKEKPKEAGGAKEASKDQKSTSTKTDKKTVKKKAE
ncbi:MAG: hypothetical protein K8F91_12090 [Candidatus Obscuribacterales bacterium]|nr:hypothetical protein [Candidatus Obscuribacterales bacterium]